MTRGRTTAQKAADTARNSGYAVLLELRFDSGILRLYAGPHDLVLGDDTYYATGDLLRVDEHGEAADGTEGLAFTLSGLNAGIGVLARSEPYRGRIVLMGEQRYNDAHQLVETPTWEFIGRMVGMTCEESPGDRTATVQVQAEHFGAEARRPVHLRFSDAEQRRRFPADKGFEYVTSMTELTLQRVKE